MKLTHLLLAVVVACMMLVASAKDLYKILEIPRQATDQEIKKAFRKLSKKYHPDFNPNDTIAATKYAEITEAHDVLSDTDKRAVYDMDGYDALKDHAQRQNQPMDPIAAMFGHQQGGRPKGPNAMVEIPVSLEDLFLGKEVKFTIKRDVICPHCRGSGSHDGQLHTCSKCKGQGAILTVQNFGGFAMQQQTQCPVCSGRGKVPKNKCQHCHGTRVTKQDKELVAVIEKGMKHEQQIVFEKESQQSPHHTPGDVIAIVKQQPHARFKREGDDLRYTLQITLKEALLGFDKTIVQLDGTKIPVKRTQVTQPFQVLTLQGHGMPQYQFASQRGNLYVECIVSYPQTLTQEQKDKINALF